MRWQLDCTAVVVSIDRRFLRLLKGDPGAPASTRRSQVFALAIGADEPEAGKQVLADPGRLADPVMAGEMGFGFYAGLPLRLSSGCNMGLLAAVDFTPRSLAKNELAALKTLASIVAQIIEFRLATSGPGARQAA